MGGTQSQSVVGHNNNIVNIYPDDIDIINNAVNNDGYLYYDSEGNIIEDANIVTDNVRYFIFQGKFNVPEAIGRESINELILVFKPRVGDDYISIYNDEIKINLDLKIDVVLQTDVPLKLLSGIYFTGFFNIVNTDSNNIRTVTFGSKDEIADSNDSSNKPDFRIDGSESSGDSLIIKNISNPENVNLVFRNFSATNFILMSGHMLYGGYGQVKSCLIDYAYIQFYGNKINYALLDNTETFSAKNVMVEGTNYIHWINKADDATFDSCYIYNTHFFEEISGNLEIINCFAYHDLGFPYGFGRKFNCYNKEQNEILLKDSYVIFKGNVAQELGVMFEEIATKYISSYGEAEYSLNIEYNNFYCIVDSENDLDIGFISINLNNFVNSTHIENFIDFHMRETISILPSPYPTIKVTGNRNKTFSAISKFYRNEYPSELDYSSFDIIEDDFNNIKNEIDINISGSSDSQVLKNLIEFDRNKLPNSFLLNGRTTDEIANISNGIYPTNGFRNFPWGGTYKNSLTDPKFPHLIGEVSGYDDPHINPLYGPSYDLPHDENTYLLLEGGGILIKGKTWFVPIENALEHLKNIVKNIGDHKEIIRRINDTTYFKYVKIEYKDQTCIIDMEDLSEVVYTNEVDLNENNLPKEKTDHPEIVLTEIEKSTETIRFEQTDITEDKVRRYVTIGNVVLTLISNTGEIIGNNGVKVTIPKGVNYKGALIRKDYAIVTEFTN